MGKIIIRTAIGGAILFILYMAWHVVSGIGQL